jgi:3-methyladenine DNA glycosylase Mpg
MPRKPAETPGNNTQRDGGEGPEENATAQSTPATPAEEPSQPQPAPPTTAADQAREAMARMPATSQSWEKRESQWGGSTKFDHFTERAKRVMVLAQQEAGYLNHNYIGTEHILLGLVAETEGIAAQVLAGRGVDLGKVRESVQFIIGRGDRAVQGSRSLTPRSKRVVELAIDEARRLNHAYVGTEHLLLGLIREGEGIAAGVLISLGVDLDATRDQVIQMVKILGDRRAEAVGSPAGRPTAAPKDSVITCRIESGDLEALDALIEAGIRSTRSDAAAWLIHAGIQANLTLFDKVYATVAEIRRLREQAQSAAQEIEGQAQGGAQTRPAAPQPVPPPATPAPAPQPPAPGTAA